MASDCRRRDYMESDSTACHGIHGEHRLRGNKGRHTPNQLDPLPTFLPEKRAFFLEGANQYDFGLGLGGESPQFIPFFSRQIGLLDGEQIPINAGVKLNGRVGDWNLALLDVQTRETVVSPQVVTDLSLPSPRVPGTNLLAGRVSYDFNENLRVGTIFTNGDPARTSARTHWLASTPSGIRPSSGATRIYSWARGAQQHKAMSVRAAKWGGDSRSIIPTTC